MSAFRALFDAPIFNGEEAEAHQEIQRTFGELWTHIPCLAKPNYQAQPDPSKQKYAIVGIFEWDAEVSKLGLEETGVSTRTGCIAFFACDLRYPVKRGDQFFRCATGTLYEARDRQRDSLSGVDVPVTELGRQS